MINLAMPVLFGLWGWLFVEHLTQRGHIFSFLTLADPGLKIERLWVQYTTCAVCNAGLISSIYATVITIWYCLDMGDVSATQAVVNGIGTLISNLFISATIAMSVARVMTIKF